MLKIFKNIEKSSLIKVICILLLVSIGINIYQQVKCNEFERNLMNSTETYMNNHQVMFSNALLATPPDAQNIKDLEILNKIIEGVGEAEIYYEGAMLTEQYSRGKKLSGDVGIETRYLISCYISEIKSFRLKLTTKENLTSEYINSEMDVINDLKIIAEWLQKKTKNNDFSFYGDKDIYENVYEKLSSNLKFSCYYNR